MNIPRIVVSVLFSCFSVAVMAYISMAMPIGPWIESTLVLIALLIFSVMSKEIGLSKMHSIGLTTAAGGIGGILATALGFSFPALYFIDAMTFKQWLSQPFFFMATLAGLSFAAASFGCVIAELFAHRLIVKEAMPFPIGELVYKMITIKNRLTKALQLSFGFIGTTLFLFWQSYTTLIASAVTLFSGLKFSIFSLPALVVRTDLFAMFWAIGFVTGHVIALPLIVGFLAKVLCIDPLHLLYNNPDNVVHAFFARLIAPLLKHIIPQSMVSAAATVSAEEFTVAFCSGIVLFGVLTSFFEFPKVLFKAVKNLRSSDNPSSLSLLNELPWLQLIAVLLFNILFLSFFGFSWITQLYLLFFTFLWTYQVLVIAGKIGIAPLGRFATFVMVPALVFFNLSPVQIVFIATFVEIAVGVASDVLFGRKMAHLAALEKKKIVSYQWLGLVISSIAAGCIFYLLLKNLSLGVGGELPVYKAYSRSLLINVKHFDVMVLMMGLIFGYLLTLTRVNPTLVLGGILMPVNYSFMLIIGGLSTYLLKNKEDYYPLASGVFAANSLWMIMKAFCKICS